MCAASLAPALAPRLSAQQRSVARDGTPLLRSADGGTLATLEGGAELSTGKSHRGLTEVTLDGWIWSKSVDRTRRDGFDVIVTADGGENLRDGPNGALVARLEKGMLLDRRGARGNWVHVRRSGWVSSKALGDGEVETAALEEKKEKAAQNPAPDPKAQQPAKPKRVAARSRTASTASSDSTAPAAAPAASASGASAAGPSAIEIARSAELLARPDGDTIGTAAPGATGRVLARAGDWVRVQLEGWVHEADVRPSSGGTLLGVTAAELRAEPDRYVGQTLEWRVQFIAIQTADELRTELPPGQPYLLTRGPLPESGFVYVIVPRDQLAQFKSLPALQELVLRVTVRAAHTKFLATPVVELASVVSGTPGK